MIDLITWDYGVSDTLYLCVLGFFCVLALLGYFCFVVLGCLATYICIVFIASYRGLFYVGVWPDKLILAIVLLWR